MSTHAFTLVRNNLVDATVDLFAAFDVVATPTGPASVDAHENRIATIIGFAAEKVRGSVVVVTDVDAIDAWRSALGDTRVNPCDVLGELANLLAGRLKIRLIGHGLPIMISTPTNARGRDLVIAALGSSSWLGFQALGAPFSIRIDVAFDADFAFIGPPSTPPAQPGELILF